MVIRVKKKYQTYRVSIILVCI